MSDVGCSSPFIDIGMWIEFDENVQNDIRFVGLRESITSFSSTKSGTAIKQNLQKYSKVFKKKKINKIDKSTKQSDVSESSDKKSTKTDKQIRTETDKQMFKETERKLGPKFSFRLFKMNGIFSGPNKEKKSGNFAS